MISLESLIDLRLFQNQVHRGGAEVAEGFYSSDPIGRRLREPLARRGDGDWIRNFVPAELRSSPFNGYGTYYEACIERTETFLFGGISR